MIDAVRQGAFFKAVLATVLLVLAGCTTTGSTFNASRLDLMTPGSTTLSEASALLKADPVDVYAQGDGSVLARWAHRASFVPDAVYFNRELWLQFDQYGYFERVVKSVNVPQTGQVKHAPYAGHTTETRPAFPAPTPAPVIDAPVASPVQM